MWRMVVTICAVSHLATALPQQRPSQLGANAGPRPNPQANSAQASTLGSFGPNFSQQLSFGNPSAQISQAAAASAAANSQRRGPATYQSPQPILISQSNPSASPATPGASFASFPGSSPFGGAGRQILTLRSPQNSQADDDEYEYEDDDEPTIPSRPTPGRQTPTRAPVRIIPQNQVQNLNLGQVTGRFGAQQQQQQQRQRQQVNQQQQQIAAQPQQSQRVQGAPRPTGNAGFGIDGKRNRLTTPPPIQTVNRYMKQNDDGSITWGYENEDGTFKEETLGSDCVVRGKYGYIDPEGNKREYEYQTGNPCDPNKKDQEEVEEEDDDLPDGPTRNQQIAGLVNARPRPVQRRPQGGIPQYQAQPQYQ